SLEEVRTAFNRRVEARQFIPATQRVSQPGRMYTTEEMIELERSNVRFMRAGQNQHTAMVTFETRRAIEKEHQHLNNSQREAVEAGRPYHQLQEAGMKTARPG